MAELAIASAIASIAAAGVSAAGTLAAGASAKASQEFRAKQEQQAAGEARASGQREAFEERRKAGLVTSRIQALSAAGGGGADDPTIVDLSSDVAGRGEYFALMDMFRGENKARGLEDSAVASRMTGDAAQKGSYYKAGGTLLEGFGSAADRYSRANKGFSAPDYG